MTDGSTLLLMLRTTVSLAVVLGLIVWAARAITARQGGLLGTARRHVPVTVLARQSLTRHAGLSVVQVGEEILVLGVTDAEVGLITRLDPTTLPDPATTESVEPTDRGPDPSRTTPYAGAFPVPAGARSFADALRAAAPLPLRRDLKRQGAGAREAADRVLAGPDRPEGRHRG